MCTYQIFQYSLQLHFESFPTQNAFKWLAQDNQKCVYFTLSSVLAVLGHLAFNDVLSWSISLSGCLSHARGTNISLRLVKFHNFS